MRLIVCAACCAAFIFGGCQRLPQPSSHTNETANANAPQSAGANVQGPGAHQEVAKDAGEAVAGPAHAKAAPSSMGGGGEAIDTSKYDAEVERLQKQSEKKGLSEADRATLAHAYLDRANALTKARQYRAALGDYRRTLKYDPANDEARQMAGTIVAILQQMGRDVPVEGAEPSPLPYQQ